jgi:uncharacterized membrane protein
MLTTIVGAMVLIGFVVTVTVLAIHMATGTFSARYLRDLVPRRLLQATLTALVGTAAFAFSLLRQVSSARAPDIGVSVAGALVALGFTLFLPLFSRFVHRLRPVAVVGLAGQIASRMVTRLIQRAETGTQAAEITDDRPALTVRSRRDGAI